MIEPDKLVLNDPLLPVKGLVIRSYNELSCLEAPPDYVLEGLNLIEGPYQR